MFIKAQPMREKTRPNTRRKMRLADLRTDGQTDGRTDKRTNGRTDTPSYRDATAHLKTEGKGVEKCQKWGKKKTTIHRL